MKNLILLHGALGTNSLFDSLAAALANDFHIHRFNFSGHGEQPFNAEGFGIEKFADELETYLNEHGLNGSPVFGYSMGGYVALCLEAKQPGSFSQIVTLGTKFAWTPESAKHETSRLVPEVIKEKVPKFAALLAARHVQWEKLMEATASMMMTLGNTPLLDESTLAQIKAEVTIMLGDQDNMVGEEESKWATKNLPKATFQSLQDCLHPIERVDAAQFSAVLRSIF